jgi:hypothetical protein
VDAATVQEAALKAAAVCAARASERPEEHANYGTNPQPEAWAHAALMLTQTAELAAKL